MVKIEILLGWKILISLTKRNESFSLKHASLSRVPIATSPGWCTQGLSTFLMQFYDM